MKIFITVPSVLLLVTACASPAPLHAGFHAPLLSDPLEAEVQPIAGMDVVELPASEPVAAKLASTPAELDVRHLNVILGVRNVRDGRLDDLNLDDEGMLGVEADAYDHDSGSGWEAGVMASHDDGHQSGHSVDARFTEIYGGFRQTFSTDESDPHALNRTHPYVGLGATILHGDIDVGPQDGDDTTLGAYVHAGVNWSLENDVRLGLDLRHVFANLKLFGDNIDADYNQLALTVGFPF